MGWNLSPETSFPSDVWREGYRNSFHDRIRDAISRWNHQMEGLSVGHGMVEAHSSYNDVSIDYDWILEDGVLGQTQSSCTLGNSTVVQRDRGFLAQHATMTIDKRGEWFTQDDSRRGAWEVYEPAGNYCTAGTYACGKTHDFGSVVTHELGHALGLYHPLSVDTVRAHSSSNPHPQGSIYRNDDPPAGDHHGYAGAGADGLNFPEDGDAGAAMNYADCQGSPERGIDPRSGATMCPYLDVHRTEQRTLHFWDTNYSLAQHYVVNRWN